MVSKNRAGRFGGGWRIRRGKGARKGEEQSNGERRKRKEWGKKDEKLLKGYLFDTDE